MKRAHLLLLVFVPVLTGATGDVLRVGVKEAPPFSSQQDGRWDGISVALARQVAAEQGKQIKFIEAPTVPALFDLLRSNTVDFAIGAITITADRERIADFSVPYYQSGLAVASRQEAGSIRSFVRQKKDVLKRVAIGVFLFPLVFGFIIYLLERKTNPQFKSCFDGYWWSVVTYATVGYGDKVPNRILSRIVAIVWLHWGIISFATISGLISSILTVSQLQTAIQSTEDLYRVRVGTVAGTTGSEYLSARNIDFTTYDSADLALQALSRGDIGAVVYDEPVLAHYIRLKSYPLALAELHLTSEEYGFALPLGSSLRKPISIALLHIMERPTWGAFLEQYKGKESSS